MASGPRRPSFHLNDGLVTRVVLPRSGKTALADLIAFACNAEDPQPGPASFVGKAEHGSKGSR